VYNPATPMNAPQSTTDHAEAAATDTGGSPEAGTGPGREAPPRTTPRHRTPSDIRWFLAALRRARIVRRRLTLPLHDTVLALAVLAPTHPPSPETAWVAAVRASGRAQRVAGGPDTCLVRALIAGALLAARGDVRLHLGFRPGQPNSPADGHAWIAGGDFELGREGTPGLPYDPALTVPFPSLGSRP